MPRDRFVTRRRTALVLGGLLAIVGPGRARAEHDHGGGDEIGAASTFGVAVSLVAAKFDTMLYGGDYQGVAPSVRWFGRVFAVSATLPFYRLQKNGKALYGPGDGSVHAVAGLVDAGPTQAGVALAVSLPFGDDVRGLGMGHVMVMPALWGSHARGRVAVGASAGYGRAIGGESDHDHGAWPLVEPMNISELTWSGSVDVTLARQLRAGARMSGGIPVGDAAGATRVVGGLRVGWTEQRVVTTATVQVGIAGDPFTVRGMLETALRF